MLKLATLDDVTQQKPGEAAVAPEAGDDVASNQVSAEIVADSGANQQQQAQEPTATETKQEAPVSDQEPSSSDEDSQQTTDPWQIIAERTQGVIRDEETLKEALERFQKYEKVLSEREELEKTLLKPASPYVKALNDLVSQGASKEQVKAFIKLNEWGDLNELSPEEILVAKRVLVDGNSEEVARYMLSKQYNLAEIEDEYGKDSIEYKAAVEEMRVKAQAARAELEKYRAEITTVEKTGISEQEQQALQAQAEKAQYVEFIKREAPKIAKEMPKDFNYGGVKVAYTDEFNQQKADIVKDFFTATNLPLTRESIEQAEEYVRLRFMHENGDLIVNRLRNAIESELTEKISNKYENRTGLPTQKSEPVDITDTSSFDDDPQYIIGRELGLIR